MFFFHHFTPLTFNIFFFFFTDTATTEIYTLSLHDALPISAKLQPAGAIYFMMSEEDVRRVLSYPHAMIGSDGLPHDANPHPRLWGTFPRVLGHYARDLKLFPLETAVYKMTGLAARGVIKDGAHADITLFDPDTVIDAADFEHSTRPAKGIAAVIVNGDIVW